MDRKRDAFRYADTKPSMAAVHPLEAVAEPLFVRGRDALILWTLQVKGEELEGISTMAIVTRSDFRDNFELVMDFAVRVKTVNVLEDDGKMIALLCPHRFGGS